MLNIVVCVKQVLDPEAPTSAYKIDDTGRRVINKGVPPVISPFDENALEAALRLKDNHEARITVISLGQGLSRSLLRKCLAAGADDLVLLEDEAYADRVADSYGTAIALVAAIEKIGKFDVVLTGMQAADSNNGTVGPFIAEAFDIASVTSARHVEFDNGLLKVSRVLPDGYEVVGTSLPALVTVSNELGALRSVSVPQQLAARKKPIKEWRASDINVDLSSLCQNSVLKLFLPQRNEKCEFIEGETDAEMGENLAVRLKEAGIIPLDPTAMP